MVQHQEVRQLGIPNLSINVYGRTVVLTTATGAPVANSWTVNPMNGAIVPAYSTVSGFFEGPVISTGPDQRTGSQQAFPISFPAGVTVFNDYFEVTLRNWNYCNPWNGFQSYPATNSPNAANAKTTTARIVVVDAPPAPTVASKTICSGGNRTLTVTSPVVGTIKWYSNSSLTTWLADGASYTPPQTAVGSYPFWVVDRSNTGLNCQSPATAITLTINSIPNKPGISGSGPLSFCFAGSNSVTLTALPNSPPVVSSYQWYKGGSALAGGTASTITLSLPSDNGTYTVQTFGIPTSNCPSPLSDPVTVTIYSLTNITHPVDRTICELGTTTFSAIINRCDSKMAMGSKH